MSQFDEEHGLDGPTCAKCGMVNCESVLGCARRVAIRRKSEADYARGVADERARVVAWLRGNADELGDEMYLADRIERGDHESEGV